MPIAIVFAVRPPFLVSDNIIFQIWILFHNFQRSVHVYCGLNPASP